AYLETVKATSDEGTEDNEVLITKLNSYLDGSAGDAPAAKEEAPKEEASVESSEEESAGSEDPNGKDHFKVLKIDENDISKIREAQESGLHVYGMTIHIQKECLLKAARAFLVFKALEDFGDILHYDPASQDIEDEKFDLAFSCIMSSDSSDTEAIKSSVGAVSEIESVDLGEVTAEMYEKPAEEKVEEKAEEPAAPAPAPAAKPAAKADAKAQTPAAKKAANKPVTARTVRVDIEKLDALMNQVSELIIAKNSIVSISASEQSGTEYDSQVLQEQIEYLERITTNLHESVMKVRMVPIESTVNKFPRMIRDLSRKLNKPMDLVMTGEETELDRTVVDQIGDPLQHLLRNSADHGIESPEVRKAAGKPEEGSIFLNAFQEGNNVIIQVGDDGGGIDTERVLQKAIERGIVSPEDAETLSQKEIIDFLFMPSFSMAKQITDISGRGVGLDVVKSNIEALGGDVEVKSTLGQGSTFTVRLPLTLAIIQALMVEIRDEKYAIALGSIMNIEDISVNDIKYVEAKEVIHLRGLVIPIIRLDQLLDCEPREEEPENLTVVVVKKGDSYAGLVVDNLMGQQEIVIKSLGKVIENNKLISGATILGDGEVALIIDVNTLI
nr:chemotaxis protein CheA [Lachnospiraceae bacterium]